jgi:hypothetical protein
VAILRTCEFGVVMDSGPIRRLIGPHHMPQSAAQGKHRM